MAEFPHVDGSGRGLKDGECIHCGDVGELTDIECRARLRGALDEVALLLGMNGCDCECGHDFESHDADCDRCLACRVDAACRGVPLG